MIHHNLGHFMCRHRHLFLTNMKMLTERGRCLYSDRWIVLHLLMDVLEPHLSQSELKAATWLQGKKNKLPRILWLTCGTLSFWHIEVSVFLYTSWEKKLHGLAKLVLITMWKEFQLFHLLNWICDAFVNGAVPFAPLQEYCQGLETIQLNAFTVCTESCLGALEHFLGGKVKQCLFVSESYKEDRRWMVQYILILVNQSMSAHVSY